MAKELEPLGLRCGRYTAGTLMKWAGVEAKRRRKLKATTDSKHRLPVALNLLNRMFAVTRLNYLWVGDITFIWASDGWLRLSVGIDLSSRCVIGWSMNKYISRRLVMDTLTMAIWRRKPSDGLIFHSDRGSRYCSHDSQKLLKKHGILASMSRKVIAGKMSLLRVPLAVSRLSRYFEGSITSRPAAGKEITDSIEMFYTSRRRHSYLGYLNPLDFKNQLIGKKAA